MFNNCNSKTNGELYFFNHIKKLVSVIFDVGCRDNSEFTRFDGEVHYFEPVNSFINKLKVQDNINKVSHFNNFGLGKENKELYYYPKYQSFYDRINSCGKSNESDKILLTIKKAKNYIIEKNIENIDFLKIDTEGHELDVLKGFEEYLKKVKIIQFEYGGTFLDSNIKLIDVIKYLQQNGFHKFSYLSNNKIVPIQDFADHYQYCNIVCVNINSNIIAY